MGPMRNILLLVIVVLPACYGDADYFNERRAVHVCKANDKCSDEARFTPDSPFSGCEETETERFAECPASCVYSQDAAQECMRGIRDLKRNCSVNVTDSEIEACERVYTDCGLPEEFDGDCDATPFEHKGDLSCAVTPGTNGWGLLLLPLVVSWRRRRQS